MSRRRPSPRWCLASLNEVIDRDPIGRGLDGRLVALGYTRVIESTSWRAGPSVARRLMIAYRLRGAPTVTVTLPRQAGDLVKR